MTKHPTLGEQFADDEAVQPTADRIAPLEEIATEMQRQYELWGKLNHADLYWLGIAGEEFGEVAKALIEGNRAEARAELVQLGAVCASWIECIDRNP